LAPLLLASIDIDRAAGLCYDTGSKKGESAGKIVEKLEAKHRVIPEEVEQVFNSYVR
jgi:hypothetical protein